MSASVSKNKIVNIALKVVLWVRVNERYSTPADESRKENVILTASNTFN